MKWIKKVASTPLDTIAKVINSLVSGDDKTTNAPSIKAVTDALAAKVDKITGKGLSANDYTDADKAIVAGVTAALDTKANKITILKKTIEYSYATALDSFNFNVTIPAGTWLVVNTGFWTSGESQQSNGRLVFQMSVNGVRQLQRYTYIPTGATSAGVNDSAILNQSGQVTYNCGYIISDKGTISVQGTLDLALYFIKLRDDATITPL